MCSYACFARSMQVTLFEDVVRVAAENLVFFLLFYSPAWPVRAF